MWLLVNAGAVVRLTRWFRPWAGWAPAALLFLAIIVFEPARDTVSFGQVNLVLLVLVCADLAALTRHDAARRGDRTGRLVGVLDRRALGHRPGRPSPCAAWSPGSTRTPPGWLAAVAVTLAVWWLRAGRAAAVGDDRAGFALTGAPGCLISPVTWVHHLVWLLPALFQVLERRPWPVTAVLWFILSSSIVWLWVTGSGGWGAAAGSNTYVWMTLALLVLLPRCPQGPGRRPGESLLSPGDFRTRDLLVRLRRAQPGLRLRQFPW